MDCHNLRRTIWRYGEASARQTPGAQYFLTLLLVEGSFIYLVLSVWYKIRFLSFFWSTDHLLWNCAPVIYRACLALPSVKLSKFGVELVATEDRAFTLPFQSGGDGAGGSVHAPHLLCGSAESRQREVTVSRSTTLLLLLVYYVYLQRPRLVQFNDAVKVHAGQGKCRQFTVSWFWNVS